MMRRETALALAIALLGAAAPTLADVLQVPVTGYDVITSPEGRHRVLVQLGSLEGLEDRSVGKAVFVVPVPAALPAGVEEHIRVYPISRPWTPGAVSWTTGWEEPGGDYHHDLYARGTVRRQNDATRLEVDLTSMVLSIQGGANAYGLLVTVPPYEGRGFDGAARQLLETVLSNSHVEVVSRGRRPPNRT